MGLIRLFLAVVVAADHWRVIVLSEMGILLEDNWKAGFNAGYAVMFFYVISGFLITYTLQRNYKIEPAGLVDFYRNRFIRIFSLYWPLVLLTFAMFPFAWDRFVAASFADQLTGVFLIGMDWRLAFASYPQPHLEASISTLHQAWTLGAELTFYLFAPFLMRSWRIGATLLVASFGLRAYFVIENGTDVQNCWTYQFIGTTLGFFMLGHLAAMFGRHLANPVFGLGLLIGSVATMGWMGSYDSFDTLRFWVSTIMFTLALPGVFAATKSIPWMNLAGDLSYPLYLVHTGVLVVVGPWLVTHALPVDYMPPTSAGYVSVAVFVVIATVAALIVHQLIEVPTARAMQAVLRGKKPRRATT